MEQLAQFITAREEEILDRAMTYAADLGFLEITSQVPLAWRMAIRGLAGSLAEMTALSPLTPELTPLEDYRTGPAGDFAILEAKMHSDRGVTLPQFLGMMKYFRQSFNDSVSAAEFDRDTRHRYHRYIDRFFDRVELGFISAWIGSPEFSREV
jgi:diguanylate cyclase